MSVAFKASSDLPVREAILGLLQTKDEQNNK